MKNNTKLIMETWRRFLNEENMQDDGSEEYSDEFRDQPAEFGYQEDYAEDALDPIDPEGDGEYDESGEAWQARTKERHGHYFDPEERRPSGPPVPADDSLADDLRMLDDSAPMLDEPDSDYDDIPYEESEDTYDPELDSFDNTADREEYLKYYQK